MTALRQHLRHTEDLKNINERLWLDQQSYMPPAALAERIRHTGIIQDLVQQRLTSPELGRLLDEDTEQASWLAVARRERENALRMGDATWTRFLQTAGRAFDAWVIARDGDDWSAFEPWLAEMVAINRDFAERMGYAEHPMDALLSVYVPGPSHAEITEVFEGLKGFLIDARRRRVADEPVYDVEGEPHELVSIMREIGELIGFDFARGGVGFTPHGYTSIAGPRDARVTIRQDVPLFQAVSTAVHEYGHALYGQGVAEELWETPAQHGSMPYIQESQSKFWENIVGRRADFGIRIGEILARHYPQRSAEDWGRAYHRSLTRGVSSPVRVAADEISFNLHIILRYEIECGLLDGTIPPDRVPEVWDAKSEEYLGIVPASLGIGALQDPHWARRFFGLFTAYVVGNVSSAQLARAMAEQGVSIEEAVRRADFGEVRGWLRENVHGPGGTVTLQEMLVNATGSRMSPDAYRDHLRERYAPGG
ncbi:MAG: hypothetical protein WA971_15875 [Microbacterium sp.]